MEKGALRAPRTRTSRPDVGLQAPARLEEDRHAAASLGVGQGQQADILAGREAAALDRRARRVVKESDLGPGRLGLDVVDVPADGQGVGLVELELAGQGLLQELGVAGHGRRSRADQGGLVLVNSRHERRPVDGLARQQTASIRSQSGS